MITPLSLGLAQEMQAGQMVGAFPDGQSALMLVAARLRHVAGTKWGTRRYLDMTRLTEPALTEPAPTEPASNEQSMDASVMEPTAAA